MGPELESSSHFQKPKEDVQLFIYLFDISETTYHSTFAISASVISAGDALLNLTVFSIL